MEEKIEEMETMLTENLDVQVHTTALTRLPTLCPQCHLPPGTVEEASALLLRASPPLACWVPSPLTTQELCFWSQWSILRPPVTWSTPFYINDQSVGPDTVTWLAFWTPLFYFSLLCWIRFFLFPHPLTTTVRDGLVLASSVHIHSWGIAYNLLSIEWHAQIMFPTPAFLNFSMYIQFATWHFHLEI